MESGDEKDAFYVVRKGDMIGVYGSFKECQEQAGSSVRDAGMSVYKGYGWPQLQGADELISSYGLKNPLFSLNASYIKDDSVFGKLIPCPLQQPSSSSTLKRWQQQIGESSHPQKLVKIESSEKILSCTIEFDGASKGNPGKAGAGAVLRASHDNSVLFYLREGVGIATNNVAEYRALILALKFALQKGFSNVRVFGDSMLVCMQVLSSSIYIYTINIKSNHIGGGGGSKQVQDAWKTKHPKMTELCKQAKDLKSQFKSFHIQHIDREFNSLADAQANHAINLPEGQTKEIAGG